MFGYIVPCKEEMKVRDYEMFKSYYCGLCRAIGKENGQIPRLALNYDIAFLGLVLSSISDEEIKVDKKNCIAHPLNKRSFVYEDKALDYAANIGTMLVYFNLIDDWNDDRSLTSLLGSSAIKRASNSAKKRYENKYNRIEKLLNKLSELESNKEKEFDIVADVFGKIMEDICDYDVLKNNKKRTALKWLGYNTGRWIYILDAYDDLEEDYKDNGYNPLIEGLMYADEDLEAFKNRIKDRVEFTLISSLSEISKSFELLDINKNKEIIDNIVYLGMRKKMDTIMKNCGGCKDCDDKSVEASVVNTKLKEVL